MRTRLLPLPSWMLAVSSSAVMSGFLPLSISLSITFVAGILLTHRIAGPIYRFTSFLKGVNRGQHPDICRIRPNDELHDFCALLNETTAPLRDKHQDEEAADETIIRAA